ncbi:MAG: hypothetical protein CMJ83_16100 [Planctomycetes bacterium]|nr:hypothetical protein [Planctomycetota bacterium]
MRILYVIHAWPPEGKGGTEAHAHQVGQGLAARGHQIGVFARTGRPDRPEYEVTTGWEGPLSITRVNNTFRDTPSFPWVYKNARIHTALEAELSEFKPDLVHVHHLTGLTTTIIEAVKSRGIPLVMTLHDFWTICPRGQRVTRDLELCEDVDRHRCYGCLGGLWPHIFHARESEPTIVDVRGRLSPKVLAEWDRHMAYVLNLCDVLIAPSAFHRERMLDFPIDPDRIISLPHGQDHAPFDGQLREPKVVQRIGYIGSVIPVKGAHLLLEAFKGLDRGELELHIHGEMPPFHDDTTYGDRLRDMARGMRNVVFHEAYEAEEVPSILANLDLLIVPSLWWETFCLTAREGMLAGVPVIVSDHGALREALDGERDGLFFRVGDVEDLRDKIELVINDDALRERLMNRGGSVKSLTEYTEEIEDVYAETTRASRRREASLVVAPPSFPGDSDLPPSVTGIDLATVPWDKLAVGVNQSGSAAVSLSTRMPTGDAPSLAVDVNIADGGQEIGKVELTIDLAALGDARPGVPAELPASTSEPSAPSASESVPALAASKSPAPESAEEPVKKPVEPKPEQRKSRRRRSRNPDSRSAPAATSSPSSTEPDREPSPEPDRIKKESPVEAVAPSRARSRDRNRDHVPPGKDEASTGNGRADPTPTPRTARSRPTELPSPARAAVAEPATTQRIDAPGPAEATRQEVQPKTPRVHVEEIPSSTHKTERWSMGHPPTKTRKVTPG